MKILTVSNYYPPYYLGANEMSCAATVEELARRGHEIHVLCSHWGVAGQNNAGQSAGERVYRLLHLHSFRGMARHDRLLAQINKAYTSRLDYKLAANLASRVRPYLVYVWNMGGLSMSVLSALQQLGACTVFELHDYWLLERHRELVLEPNRLKRLYRSLVEGCTHFGKQEFRHLIAISDSLKREYMNAGFPEGNFAVMRRPVPIPYAENRPIPKDRRGFSLRLLFAGRLVPEKGTHIAVQALASLSHRVSPPILFDIAGSGSVAYQQELQQMVSDAGLSDRVRFLGKIDHNRLVEMYREYDAVLVPSIWCEPLGQVVLEAMARGVCVVASDRGGPGEIITHGKDGLLVQPGDPEALAQAIARLAQNPQLCEELGQAGLETVRRRFSFQAAIDELEEYLDYVVSPHQPNRQSLPLSRYA